MKLLVTGCGRSGTQYFAAILNHLGIETSHERCFTHDKDPLAEFLDVTQWEEWKKVSAECSWIAAPFVEDHIPEDCFVVHLVRDPRKVVRCWFTHNIIETSPVGAFVQKILPECIEGTPLDKAVAYVYLWNHMLLQSDKVHMIHVEEINTDIIRDLFLECGFPFDQEKTDDMFKGNAVPTNHQSCGSHNPVSWDEIVSTPYGNRLLAMSRELGYSTSQ